MYRILWLAGREELLGDGIYDTVGDAAAAAEGALRLFGQDPPGYEIAWAETGKRVPDWRRQAALGL